MQLYFCIHLFLLDQFLTSALFFVGLSFSLTSMKLLLSGAENFVFNLLIILLAGVIIAYGAYLFGTEALIYCSPFTAVLFFILQYDKAWIIGISVSILSLLMSWNALELDEAFRFSIAIGISFAFMGLFAHQVTRYQSLLEKEASEDYLTGLMNRRKFYQTLESILASSEFHNSEMMFCYFDINDFKSINDTFGHSAGDMVLQEFARRVQHSISNLDCYHHSDSDHYFCRLSGDEFLLACKMTKESKMDTSLLNIFHEAFQEPFFIDGKPQEISVSIGVHYFKIDNQRVDSLIERADAEMYKSKKPSQHACLN